MKELVRAINQFKRILRRIRGVKNNFIQVGVGLVFLGCFGAFLMGLQCAGLIGLHGLS